MAGRGAPTEQDRSEGMPSHSEAPNDRGMSPLVTWGRAAFRFSKVTRRKGGTHSSRYRRNGYVHPQNRKKTTSRPFIRDNAPQVQ